MSASKAQVKQVADTNPALKKVLHLGAGDYHADKLHSNFRNADWKEVRMDPNPKVKPDIIGDFRQLKKIPDSSMHAIWLPHQLQNLQAHEIEGALAQCFRLLAENGVLVLVVPDMQALGEVISKGRIDDKLYETNNGVVTALDMIYGMKPLIEKGDQRAMNHTGFTAYTLGLKLKAAGFVNIKVKREGYNLWAMANRMAPDAPNRNEKITVFDPAAGSQKMAGAASDMSDELDRPPHVLPVQA